MSSRLTGLHRLAALFLLGAAPVQAQYCLDCIDLAVEETVLQQAGQVTVFFSVDAGKVGAARADAYLAAVQPDDRVEILYRMPDWEVQDQERARMVTDPAPANAMGEYRLYFVLAEPGADPLEPANWISADTADILLLPEGWSPPAELPPLDNGGGLPRVISQGGGEIHGLPVTNSLQALEQAYAGGQRFFELDFSWTTDRHLVLVHDWDQNYRRLFPGGGPSRPTKAEFDALSMVFGLEQLNVEELVAWLESHPDVRILTDIKEDNLLGLFYIAARAGSAQPRIIPQVHALRDYERVTTMGYRNAILALLPGDIPDARLLEFVGSHEPLAVTLPLERVLGQDTARALADRGVFVYAHTVNHPALFALLRERGVSGVYTDRLLPAP